MVMSLLKTKLYVPAIRPETVPRPRLIDRLNAGLHRKLTLVSAPAGFGKTTLLGVWTGACDRVVAWVSLGEGDNDLARFWAYVTAALAQVGVEARSSLEALLQSPDTSATETLLVPLLNQIAVAPEPLLLVLDDYHTITAPSIHESLAFLLEHLPPHLHVAIATRADPPLPLALLRGRGQLTELYQRDLRFSPEEATDLLNRVMGLALAPDEVGALERRTEGWIVGLQMAAISMRGHNDKAAFVRAFSSSNRYVFDYLVEEVLRRQPPHVQRFLLQTSILDRLCDSLCNAVVGPVAQAEADCAESLQSAGEFQIAADPQVLLDYLDRNNLFLSPLDDRRHWYRYHPLFADLLRQRLYLETPGLVPVLHDRASNWYQAHGHIVEAVQHAMVSGNFERSGYLIQQLGWSVFTRGELTTVLDWIAALPEDIVACHPELHVLQAWAMAKSGRLDEVERCLEAIDDDTLQGEVAAVRAYVAGVRGRLPQAVALAEQASARLPLENQLLRAIVAQNLGTAYHWSGDPVAAGRSLTRAVQLSAAVGQTHQTLTAMAILGRTWEMQGGLHQAAHTYRDALALASGSDDRPVPFAGMAHVGLAGPLYEWNDLDAAMHHALEGIRLSASGGFVAYEVAGYTRLAGIYAAQGESDHAWAALQQAEQRGAGIDYGLVRAVVGAQRVRLLIDRGNLAAAADWAEAWTSDVGHAFDAADEVRATAAARVLIAQDRPVEAQALLRRLLEVAEAACRTGSAIVILVLQALAYQAEKDMRRALAVLERALSLGSAEGYVRTFIDEGAPMLDLLRQAMVEGLASNYVAELLTAFGDEPKPVSPAVASIVEPLTGREVDVLRRIAVGLSNPEIADELFIATSTVKTHVNHIYGKLGVARRTEAVARARELCLL